MSSSQERQPRRQKKQQQVVEESESDSGSEEQYEPPKRSNRRSRQQNNQMQQRQQQGPMNQMGGGMPGTMGNVANQAMQQQQQQPQGGGGGKSDTLRLRLDLNLDIEITLKAKIHGDLELALLYVTPLLFCLLYSNPWLLSCHPDCVVPCNRGGAANLPPSGAPSLSLLLLSCHVATGKLATQQHCPAIPVFSSPHCNHICSVSKKDGQGHNVKSKVHHVRQLKGEIHSET